MYRLQIHHLQIGCLQIDCLQINRHQINHLQLLLQLWSILTFKSISQHGQSRLRSSSLSLLDIGLHLHLQTCSIMTCKWISQFSQSLGHQVHLQTCCILASKCISEITRPQCPNASPNALDQVLKVHHHGASAGVQRYGGNWFGQSDGVCIFSWPRVDRWM